MLNLNDREWRPFFLRDICDIESGCDIYDAERVLGNTPYITSSALNNGIKYFVGNNNGTLEANCISVNRNGSVGYSFYHKYPALYSNDCRKLRLKKHNNEYVALFITNQIMQQKDKYNYSIKMGTARLKKQKIMLPVDEHGGPDYSFMEQYIKERERQLIQKYKNFIGENIQSGGVLTDLKSVKWKVFYINEIFSISAGKRLTKADMDNGQIPFIGATDSNNGITNWIATPNSSFDKNVLGVNYNGSVVENFYHPYGCIFSDDVKRLHLREHADNKYILLFFKTVILQQKVKYTYGYKFNGQRMERQKILLPVNEEGRPDYEFMEQYGKQIMLQKYQQYLNYISART